MHVRFLVPVLVIIGLTEGLHIATSDADVFKELTRPRRQSDGSCILPERPLHGSYSILGETGIPIPGTRVPELKFLEIKCINNYILSGANRVFCSNGVWSEQNIRCTKSCKPLVSSSIIYECFQNGVKVDCDKPMAAGTKAFLSCRPNYMPVRTAAENIFCDDNGDWEQPNVFCTPECGTLSKGTKFAIKGFKAHLYQFPWHVGIYDRQNSTVPNIPDITCGGSIVSSNKVLSAAHCFWDPSEKGSRPADAFAVGYGKVNSQWMHESDKFAGYSDVKQIVIQDDYQDVQQGYALDIAIVVLTTVIEFNGIIKPVCIDWIYANGDDGTEVEDSGKVPGWGKISASGDRSDQLMQLTMPVVSKAKCRKELVDVQSYVTADKICAGSANGSSVCHGDSGGGLVFFQQSKAAYFLKGIVSTGPTREEQCDAHSYALFTSVLKHLKWLQDQKTFREPEVFECASGTRINEKDKCDGNQDCSDGSDESLELCTPKESLESAELEIGSCILPARPGNGTYTVLGLQEGPPSWTPISQGTRLKYKCNKNYILTGDDEILCNEGQWIPTLPRCLKPCSSLKSRDGTSITCSFNEKIIDCGKPMPPGTKVSVTCHEGPSRGIFQTLTCLDTSTWDNTLLNCFTECGVTYTPHVYARIIKEYGKKWLKQAEVPWNAIIYERDQEDNPKPVCGGALVEILSHETFRELLVITDVSCKEVAQFKTTSSIGIGLGKLYQDWEDERDIHAVYAGVRDIRRDGSNVVVLVLDQQVEDSFLIRPVCLKNQANLHETTGEMYGWNILKGKKDTLQRIPVDIIRPNPICSDNVNGTTIKVRAGQLCKEHNGVPVFKRSWENFVLRTYLLGLISGIDNCQADNVSLTVVYNNIPATVPLDWY